MTDDRPRLPMLREQYPSRDRFSFNPAVPDKQLWAIGMVVAQWGMTEMLMHNHVHQLINGDQSLRDLYDAQDSHRHQRTFWAELTLSIRDEGAFWATT